MRSKSLHYMPALDGLRALSVAIVFAIHAFPQASFPGGLGVDVFFVISGFLITRILLKELRMTGGIDLKAFYIKRALRLYPALLVVSLAFLAAFFVLRRGIPFEELAFTGIAVAYLSNIWMTVSGEYIGHLTHTWSLAMEEQFYIIWPALLLLLVKSRIPRPWVIMLVAALGLASLVGWAVIGSDQSYNPLTKAGGLLGGCVTAFLVDRKPWQSEDRRPWQNKKLAYAALAVFVVVFAAETLGLVTREFSLPVVSVTLPFLILHAAFGRGFLVRALSAKWLVHLGVISYGLYLWHYPVLSALHSFGLNGVIGALIAATITYLAAAISYRLIEKPVLQFKERLTRRPSLVPAR